MYTCPVCAYPELADPPMDQTICACCGVEFGYDDASKSHAQLRREWIGAGMRWFSRETPPPTGWNGWRQDDKIEKVPVKGVIPLAEMVGDDEEDTKLLRVMANGAAKFLHRFQWCKSIRSSYLGDGYGGIAGVFLFRIEPSREGIDEWLWVVFGDVPPAFS